MNSTEDEMRYGARKVDQEGLERLLTAVGDRTPLPAQPAPANPYPERSLAYEHYELAKDLDTLGWALMDTWLGRLFIQWVHLVTKRTQ
jgi:hypothetical protein